MFDDSIVEVRLLCGLGSELVPCNYQHGGARLPRDGRSQTVKLETTILLHSVHTRVVAPRGHLPRNDTYICSTVHV